MTNVGEIHPGKNQRFLFKGKENIPKRGRVETKIWSNPLTQNYPPASDEACDHSNVYVVCNMPYVSKTTK